MNSAQPDISVITVNYNGYHDTCEFIDSWVNTVTSVPYEIIVVDNGSTANEGLLLQQKYPSVHVIRSEQNLGIIRKSKCSRVSKRKVHFTKRSV